MMLRPFAPLLALVLACGQAAGAATTAPPRPGDPGSVFDAAAADERFPEMKDWAEAGVEGGVPRVTVVVARAKPGDDLQPLIDAAPTAVGKLGVIQLEAGTWTVAKTLKLKSGVVLRGAGREQTILSATLDGSDNKSPYGCGTPATLQMATWSALEDLGVENALVKAKPESEYVGEYKNFPDLMTQHVQFGGKVSNAWLQRCAIRFSGTNPITINGSHITIRDCLIDRARSKGGKGNGYLEMGGAKYVLLYNDVISNIRHISIMWKSQYVVIYKCDIQVDVNYHDGVPLQVLVEDCDVVPRGGHHWSPICYGWPPWQKIGPGPRNFFWNNRCASAKDGVVNVLRDTTGGYEAHPPQEPMVLEFGPPPKHGKLYAVTGVHRDPDAAPEPGSSAAPAATPGKVAGGSAKPAPAPAPPKPVTPAVKPLATPPAEQVAAWNAQLLARAKARLAKGGEIAYGADSAVTAIDAQDRFSLRMPVGAITLDFARIAPADRAALAKALVQGEDAEGRCLAGAFAYAAGDRAGAEQLLQRGGAGAAAVRTAFGIDTP